LTVEKVPDTVCLPVEKVPDTVCLTVEKVPDTVCLTPFVFKMDQKNVTAWLDLRNKAAHGHYEQYQKEQVALLISGVRDFITRNPA
jgi:hypothetical protein